MNPTTFVFRSMLAILLRALTSCEEGRGRRMGDKNEKKIQHRKEGRRLICYSHERIEGNELSSRVLMPPFSPLLCVPLHGSHRRHRSCQPSAESYRAQENCQESVESLAARYPFEKTYKKGYAKTMKASTTVTYSLLRCFFLPNFCFVCQKTPSPAGCAAWI